MAQQTGEKLIQDNFQKQTEAGLGGGLTDQKVVLWNVKQHGSLRFDQKGNRARPMVVMGDLNHTNDKSFGVERTGIFANIKGLVSSILDVNRAEFETWLKKYPTVQLSVHDLAKMAASHLADLYENTNLADKTGVWRLMLAFGEKSAWDRLHDQFGVTEDPRFLLASNLGAPTGADNLPYVPCFTAQNNTQAFLDTVPGWVREKTGKLHVDCLSAAQKSWDSTKQKGNTHFWIRECPMGDHTQEYPDFVLFINGLPILWVEIKTPQAGLREAVKDFQQKPNYQGAPLCLASNGTQSILTSDMTGNLETWVSYEGNLSDNSSYWTNKETNPLHGQAYLVEQLLSKSGRFEFFLTRCGAIGPDGRYMTARAQQYQALAHLERDLEWTEVCNKVLQKNGKAPLALGNRLIRQTQRTGKTHTMVRAIHLSLGAHPDLYRLSLLMVGEVLILGQIYDELLVNNIGLADGSLVIERVESRSQLNNILATEASAKDLSERKVLLANMQKISTQTEVIALDDSQKTLVVLDEGHLAQTGTTAGLREMIFPKASHLLLTATPKSEMATHYGISKKWHVLDDFGYGLAKASKMVCPVVYKRYPYSFRDDTKDLARLAETLKSYLGEDASTKDITAALQTLMSETGDDENSEQSSVGRGLARQVRRQLEEESIPERLNAIVHELQTYESNLELLPSGERIFRPRALVFDRDTESAVRIIEYIQSLNKSKKDNERNVYKGWRFGIDVSNFGKDVSGKERSFQTLNPGVQNEGALKNLLKSTDPEMRVDVLLAVGKYTKGYNNDQLALVVLLRNVAEPSLMNQIYTRPATMREGKPKGVCLDLAFGQGNILCWRESLRLYDKDMDLANLLEQKDVDTLVAQVKTELEKAAVALGIQLKELAKPFEVIRVIETMTESDRASKVRNFILQARTTVALLAKMPDSSIYGQLKNPLLGLRVTLSNLQHIYPHLVEDNTVGADGLLDGGHTPARLGEIIREALSVLGQSSLKALLGVSMEDGFSVDATEDQQTKDAVHQAKFRQARQAAVSAIEAVLGPRDSSKDTVKRKLRSSTVLLDALNRALDKLRDDILPNQEDAFKAAHAALSSWVEGNKVEKGTVEHFVFDNLEDIVSERAMRLGVTDEEAGLHSGGVLENVLRVAGEDMASNFSHWFSGLSPDWAEQNPERLANAWRAQYTKTSLMDFVGATSTRIDLHGQASSEWLSKLMSYPPNQTKDILGQTSSEALLDLPHVIGQAMFLSLEKRQAVLDAMAWKKSLAAGRGET